MHARSARMLLLSVVALLIPLVGCPQANERTTLYLDQDDSGGVLRVTTDREFTITLSANPTTGYAWGPVEFDSTVLQQTHHEYVSHPPPMPEATGVGGHEYWTFVAQAPGTTTVRLELRRRWEPDIIAPERTFEIQVHVIGDAAE